MGQHEDKIELIRKYADDIKTSFSFHIKGDIPSKKIDNALKKFASGMDRKTIIGFYDTTVMGSGKTGYIFTDTKIYYSEFLEKNNKIWYDDIESVELFNTDKKDCDKGIRFNMYDGTSISWTSCFLNKTPLAEFMKEMLEMINETNSKNNIEMNYDSFGNSGAVAGGIAAGNYGQVNNMYEEEKFHAKQGHGFAAERANNLYDKVTGHKAEIVGDDNAKNGADRIVDGVYIQSKYCATGSRCVNECFEDNGKGAFRYMRNGKPMQIEVPSDKYDAALEAMEKKIERGQVEGVTDPKDAKKIIRKGHFTYKQAQNIAKAGTIESLTYDAVNSVD